MGKIYYRCNDSIKQSILLKVLILDNWTAKQYEKLIRVFFYDSILNSDFFTPKELKDIVVDIKITF